MCIQKFIQETLAVPMNWQEFFSSYQQEVGVTNLEPSRGAIPIFFEKTSKTRELARVLQLLLTRNWGHEAGATP